MHQNLQKFDNMYQNVRWQYVTKCIKMHQNVTRCIKMWQNVSTCICGSWKPHAQIEKCITGLYRLAPANMTCTNLKIFWLWAQEKYRFGRFALFPFFNLSIKMWQNVSKHIKMWPNVSKCDRMDQTASKCDKLYQNLTKCDTLHSLHSLHQNVTKCDKMYQKSACDKMYQNVRWQYMAKCINMYQNVTRCIKMWQNVSTCICGSWKPHAQIEKSITGLCRLAPANMTHSSQDLLTFGSRKISLGRWTFPLFQP